MTAMDRHVRIELTIPGDDGHVSHRTGEAIKVLMAAGFRLVLKLDGPVFLFQDHEEPVDSSTVDQAGADRATRLFSDLVNNCGMPVCGHPRAAHDDDGCTADAANVGGRCVCPAWAPITAGIRPARPGGPTNKPGPY